MHEIIRKIKLWAGTPEVVTVAIIVLVGLASFGLGRLSALETLHEPVQILGHPMSKDFATLATMGQEAPGVKHPMFNISGQTAEESSSSNSQISTSNFQPGGQVVGSKNGTKYHFPWCAGAQRIKEENKKWFDSVAAARAAGYTPAGNCKGLE